MFLCQGRPKPIFWIQRPGFLRHIQGHHIAGVVREHVQGAWAIAALRLQKGPATRCPDCQRMHWQVEALAEHLQVLVGWYRFCVAHLDYIPLGQVGGPQAKRDPVGSPNETMNLHDVHVDAMWVNCKKTPPMMVIALKISSSPKWSS